MTPKEWDQRYYSDENWTGSSRKVDQDSRKRLERHKELVGDPVSEQDRKNPTWANGIAKAVSRHWKEVMESDWAKRFRGPRALEVLKGTYISLIFGSNTYIEGTSGVGKTATLRSISNALNIPYAIYDAKSDTSDLELVGSEVPAMAQGQDGKLVPTVKFSYGVVNKPGILGVMIDELPRLPGAASNALLQAMVERKVRVSIVSEGKPDFEMLLSPAFSIIGAGNPVGYGGQGERSRALFDRFDVGLEAGQPDSRARIQMYQDQLQHDPMAGIGQPMTDPNNFDSHFGMAGSDNSKRTGEAELGFTLREAQTALRSIKFKRDEKNALDDQFCQLCAASAAISPMAFRARAGWGHFSQKSDSNKGNGEGFVPAQDLYLETFRSTWEDKKIRKNLQVYEELMLDVEKHLAEGSNPRGEIACIRNARILRFLDSEDYGDGFARDTVHPKHMREAFRMANLARLKPYPGAEPEVRGIVEKAAKLFFENT